MSNANEPVQAGTKLQAIVGPDGREYFHPISTGGLTKREYFAALAMQGYVSDREWRVDTSPEMTARAATFMADALIAELERTA